MVLAPVFLIVFFVLAGLVIDAGMLFLDKQHLQNAVDAAAFAAARDLIYSPTTVTQTATQYANYNGVPTADVNVTSTQTDVTVSATKSVPFSFMNVFGDSSANISASATATVEAPAQYQYALFAGASGSAVDFTTSTFNGASDTVNGKAHFNYDVTLEGAKDTFNSICEVVHSITASGGGTYTAGSSPQYYSSLGNSDTFNPLEVGAPSMSMPSIDLSYYQSHATYTYSSSVTLPDGIYNGIIYVNGNVTFDGSGVQGNCTIVATGTVTMNGSNANIYGAGPNYMGIYGEQGVVLNGSNCSFYGLFVSPNGSIDFNGSGYSVYGELMAQNFNFDGGGDYFEWDSRVLSQVGSVKMTS